MNLVVAEVPFGEGSIDAHVDTARASWSSTRPHRPGRPEGHHRLRHGQGLLVEGNPQAGIQAFMQGKIRVEGDIAKLMALQSASPGPDGRRDRRPDPGHHRVAPGPRRLGRRVRLGGRRCRPGPCAAPGACPSRRNRSTRAANGHQRADEVGGVERGQRAAPRRGTTPGP